MDEELLRIIDLFDDDEVTTADKIDRPAAASYREMFDDFNARNPFANGGISLKEVNQYRKEGLTAKEITEKLNVGLSKYEEFLTKNKSKLVKVSPKKITDPDRIKALDEAAKKYGYKSFKDVPTTKSLPGKRVYGDREKVLAEATRRQKNVPVGKGSPGVPKPVGEDFVSPMRDPEIVARNVATRKKNYQASPIGQRLQWIANNGKKYDDPKTFIKAYEKHFKHKLGSPKDALFGKIGNKGKIVYLSNIDGLQNTGKTGLQGGDLFSFKKGFSEEEIFKASIIQNNPKIKKQFKELFKQVHNNVGEFSELGPESLVERLNKGKLFKDFDFVKFGVGSGITRNSLLNVANVNPEHVTSFQSVRQPLMSISRIIQNLKNPSFAKGFGISPSTATKIRGQLDNFLEGEKNLIADIRKVNNELGDVKFNQIFGGVNFEHTLAKRFGKDYKYLPRNYLLKGQFTTRNFNMFKKEVFDLPLIGLMKQYKRGKVSGEQIQKFIDDFNAKTNNYADFSFDVKKGQLAYADNAVKYDLSRYADPNIARQELIKNIDLTMSPQFQKGFSDVTALRDQLKSFKSKEAQNARNILARIGCPGKGSGGRIGFFTGQNLEACATKGAQKLRSTDPKNLSPADRRNFQNLTKTAKGIRLAKNILGPAALAYEAVFALPFAAYDYQAGRPLGDIGKNIATFGFMDKKLREAELKDIFSDYGKAQELDELGAKFDELEKSVLSPTPIGNFRQRAVERQKFQDLIPKLQQAYGTFMVDGVLDPNLYMKNIADSLAAEEELQKQYDITGQERKSKFDLSDPFMAAGGGIAGLSGGIDEGPQTVSMNPDSQGLRSLKNRVRNL